VDNYDKHDYVNSFYVDQNNDDNVMMMRYIIYRMDALDVDSIVFALNQKVQRAKYKLGITGINSKSIGIEGSSSSSSSGSFRVVSVVVSVVVEVVVEVVVVVLLVVVMVMVVIEMVEMVIVVVVVVMDIIQMRYKLDMRKISRRM